MRTIFLLAFAVAFATALSAQPSSGDCKTPVTFVKKLGEPQRRELAFSMCAASDGNVYLAGKQGDNPMIAKITTRGEQIWVRNFPPSNPNEPIEWAEIIEDSDGMIVVCGTEGASPSNRRAIVMRYDPTTGVVLWYMRYANHRPEAAGIVEKSPGGNFILQTNYEVFIGSKWSVRSEFLEVNRTDGNVAGSEVSYIAQNNMRLSSTVLNNGSLYGVGSWEVSPTFNVRPFFAKISPATLLPEWTLVLEPTDPILNNLKVLSPSDIAFAGDFAIIAGSGQVNPAIPAEGVFAYLAKHHPDGSLAWMKRYDMEMWPEAVLASTNAYIVFGRMVDSNRYGMLKTDVDGNVLEARVLSAAPASPNFKTFPNRQNLALSLPQQVLLLDHTSEANESDIVLVRTDLNLDLDDACDLLQAVQVSSQNLPAQSSPAALSVETSTPTTASATANFQADSLPVHKLCPTCPPDPNPDPCQPATFLHLIGEPGKIENISALCAAPDGNLYCSGLKGARTVIGKMNLDGAFLWAYSFVTEPYEPVLVAEIIVDSEGMIVGSGQQGDKHLAKGFAFRYDPATHQMLWAQQFDEGRPVEGGILEKTPGGNYLYYQNPQADSVIRNPEILELARTTGQIVPTFAKRYNLNPFEVAFTSVVAHNQYLYATGYGLGVLGARKMLMAMIDAGTGEVVRASAMNLGWATPSYFTGKDLIVDDTTLVALYHGSETSYTIGDGPGTTTSLFLRKFTLDNKTLWVRKYLFSHPPKELVAVPDGYVMLGGRVDRYLLKTDKEGNLLTAKRLDNPPAINNNNGEQQNQLVVLGNHLFMADFALTSSADQYTTLLKTNLNLELDFDCSHYLDYSTSDSMVSDQDANYPLFATASPATQQTVAVSMAVETMTLRETCPVCPDTVICPDKPDLGLDRVVCAGQPVLLDAGAGFQTYQWLNGPATQTLSVTASGVYIVQVTDTCGQTLRDTISVTVLPQAAPSTVTIPFYPGDTVFLAGTPYTQPDTVTLTLTTDDGCDSVVTYILRRVITTIDLVCPPDQTVSIPANQSSTAVSYPLPAAATDCPNPALTLTRLQGPPSGGLFPEGTSLVCYEAANQCGIRDTCCFTVTAQQATDETACDVKIPPGSCIKYELLSIRLDALGRPRYRMRLTNACASPLRYAYFQLPNGMTAKAPLDGATYTAPGGNTYLVRNPNASPYHSIRFKPVLGVLNNGKSDIFEYTLPKQAQMAFILVSAKLEDGSSSEAHINTFSCPVQPYSASVQQPSAQERGVDGDRALSLRPNPTSGMLLVEIAGAKIPSVWIQVLNAQGQLVLEREHTISEALQLPAGLANGLYFLLVQPADGGKRTALRFVLER